MASMVSQKGQALLAVLAFTLILAITLVYLFNTSQLLAERAKAKVLADHAAFNTATKQAQLLNANAYMNKAKITNQLAIAQAVSVASWAEHFEPVPDNTRIINMIPYVGAQIHQGITQASQAVQMVSESQGLFVTANATSTALISKHQQLLNTTYLVALENEHKLVLKNSSIGARFDSNLGKTYLTKQFISRYSGVSKDPYQGRLRMREVLLNARDDFTRSRRPSESQSFTIIPFPRVKLERRGGTELSDDMNQWKGVDTFSLHMQRWRRWRLRNYEYPIGYGSAVASKSGDSDVNNRMGYSDASGVNRQSSRRANNFKPSWDSRNRSMMGEYGVPEYWDLHKDELLSDSPSRQFTVSIFKSNNNLNTTSGISNFQVGDNVDIKTPSKITAFSTAEVYFERPLKDRNGNDTYLNNGSIEKASLFNPYWNVRLVDSSAKDMLGAVIQ
ncbi:hypothetical protein LP092_15255 (plasmid) [Moraxella bovis]|uniref:Flp pilus-assembly TadG-like N-terminal domain-containing protein n=1 Tax=Moraxella bovis TaxID=476 RepID=A0ABY6MCQ7_MORBO|nr:hypothetical protein [Moraxella bovis]UZA04725.1 hypothetical protein LP092_15255 [Moraxella bovis]